MGVILGPIWDWSLRIEEFAGWSFAEMTGGLGLLMTAALAFVALRQQIHQRSHTEAAVCELEGSYRRLVDNHLACQVILDLETQTVLDASPEATRHLGHSLEKLRGKWLGEIIGLTQAEGMSLFDRFAAGDPESVVQRVSMPDGSYREFEIFPVVTEWQGRPVVRTALYDCTARNAAEYDVALTKRALTAVTSINAAMEHAEGHTQLFQLACRHLVEEAGYAAACISRADFGPGRPLVPLAFHGDVEARLFHLPDSWSDTLPAGRSPGGQAVRSGRLQRADALADLGIWGPLHELCVMNGLRSVLALPVRSADRVQFVLKIYSRETTGFGDLETQLLQSLSAGLSRALHVHESVTKFDVVAAEKADAISRLKAALYAMIEAFGSAVDKLDPYTAGHEARVSDLSVRIAERLEFSPDIIEGIKLGALIHDIGKIGVPIQVLTKPGKLAAEELALIRTHAALGYDIVKGIAFPWPIARMVHEHHERLDGSGYPQSLVADEICIEAQIIAVADVVESMTSHRPYRPALPMAQAEAELLRGRGTRYNTLVVDACLQEIRNESPGIAAAK